MLQFAYDYDNVPLHTDEEYAKTTHFGKLIAPGDVVYGGMGKVFGGRFLR